VAQLMFIQPCVGALGLGFGSVAGEIPFSSGKILKSRFEGFSALVAMDLSNKSVCGLVVASAPAHQVHLLFWGGVRRCARVPCSRQNRYWCKRD